MFDTIKSTIASIAPKLTDTVTAVARFTAYSLRGYAHLFTDAFVASVAAYDAAFEADTIEEAGICAAHGFIHSMVSGVYISTVTELVAELKALSKAKYAGTATSATKMSVVGNLVFIFGLGAVYETMRDSPDDYPTVTEEDDIIDADAHEPTTNGATVSAD